jgi:membrane-associated phospholipid phosphatase
MSSALTNKPSLTATESSFNYSRSRSGSDMGASKWALTVLRPDRSASSLLALLDRVDLAVSRPLLELSLPAVAEAAFSVPACCFGLIPAVYLGPIALSILALSCDTTEVDGNDIETNKSIMRILQTVATLLSILFLSAWILFLKGKRWPLSQFLGKKILYPLGFPWSIGILYVCLSNDTSHEPHASKPQSHYNNKVFSLAIYSLYIWCWTVLIVLILKRWSKRLRPCLKYTREWIIANKYFPAIPIMLSKMQADESFPSGDAASAAALAIPMLYLESDHTVDVFQVRIPSTAILAFVVVFLSCAGRVYFLAHHVMDVLIGALTPYIVHFISTQIGLGIYDMVWWHPLAANMAVATYAKLSEKRIPKEHNKEKDS